MQGGERPAPGRRGGKHNPEQAPIANQSQSSQLRRNPPAPSGKGMCPHGNSCNQTGWRMQLQASSPGRVPQRQLSGLPVGRTRPPSLDALLPTPFRSPHKCPPSFSLPLIGQRFLLLAAKRACYWLGSNVHPILEQPPPLSPLPSPDPGSARGFGVGGFLCVCACNHLPLALGAGSGGGCVQGGPAAWPPANAINNNHH